MPFYLFYIPFLTVNKWNLFCFFMRIFLCRTCQYCCPDDILTILQVMDNLSIFLVKFQRNFYANSSQLFAQLFLSNSIVKFKAIKMLVSFNDFSAPEESLFSISIVEYQVYSIKDRIYFKLKLHSTDAQISLIFVLTKPKQGKTCRQFF